MAKSRKQRRPARPTNAEPGQVGRRPSQPSFLLMIGLAWVGVGVVALLTLNASWKIIPGVLFIGIGLLWLRGAVTAAARQEGRRPSS